MKKVCAAILCILMSTGAATKALSSGMETVRDIDGNVYGTVRIGNQVWMTENLRVTRYNNGVEIPLITDDGRWRKSITGAYVWYNNNESNAAAYGALYNWFAVETGRLCPPGWRVPTDEDWEELTSFLKKQGLDAGALCAAENSTGFSALPGGFRWWRSLTATGSFYAKDVAGYWWSSTETTDMYAWNRAIGFEMNKVYRSQFPKGEGFSVRAIKVN